MPSHTLFLQLSEEDIVSLVQNQVADGYVATNENKVTYALPRDAWSCVD